MICIKNVLYTVICKMVAMKSFDLRSEYYQ